MDNIYVKRKTNNMSRIIEQNVAEILVVIVFIVMYSI